MSGTEPPSSRPAVLHRQSAAGLDLAILARASVRELHLTLRPLPGETPADFFGRLAALLQEHEAAVAWQVVFGDVQARTGGVQALRKACGEVNWPVTWIQGDACGTGSLVRRAGRQALARRPYQGLGLPG